MINATHSITTATRFCLFLLCLNLMACATYEPRQLAPYINLSPENISLASTQKTNTSGTGVDFGLQTTINESDSLSNISILPGVRVRTVNPGGPTALAGIQAGDVILSIDQTPTDHPDAITSLAASTNKNIPYLFEVRRGTTVFEATVNAITISASTPPAELYRADPVASRAGYRTEIVSTNEQGNLTAATVVRTFPESPLPTYDIHIGDQIIAVDGMPITSAQHLINHLNDDATFGQSVELTLVRNNQVLERELQLWNPGKRINKVTFLPIFSYESTIDPEAAKFSFIDLWFFSLFSMDHQGSEKNYSILGLINYSTGVQGELLDENDSQ